MRLTAPTDFEILESLADGKRNVAPNIAAEIDISRDYINTRLPELTDYGLLKKIGPAPHSGLYVITDRGKAALELRECYDHAVDFDNKIESRLQS